MAASSALSCSAEMPPYEPDAKNAMAGTWWAFLAPSVAAAAQLRDDTVGLLDDRSHHITPLIRFLRCRRAAPIYERLLLRMAWAAGLWLIPGRRGAVGGEGVGEGLFDRCGVHAEGVGDLAAVDDEGFLELVLHLR